MGMPNITFRVQMFRGDFDQVWSQERMLFLMEGLVRVNQTHLRQFDELARRGLVERGYPSVYRSGLHYETEKGTEIWPDIPSCLMGTMGKGTYPGHWCDCEDLACYRVAELRELPEHYERVAPWDKARTEVADPRYPQPFISGTPEGFPNPPAKLRERQSLSAPHAATIMTAAGPVPAPGAKTDPTWAGWRKVKGGIRAKPYAKWRRGPRGNYHYHALVHLPDGRLEDPSLVLGMGRERAFAAARAAEKLRDGAPVVLQYAKVPEVMVVDPEKPSGYAGGIAEKLDSKVLALAESRGSLEGDSAEVDSYLANEINLGDTEFDVDEVIGWSRAEKRFVPRSEAGELRRLLGYGRR
jgi:hypothetical protein